jgi:hypothetical protein
MAVGKKQLGDSPLLMALRDKRVSAAIVDLDHYRFGGGLAVETDFIIRVEQVGAPKTVNGFQFENFMLSKTYSAFRTLGNQLKKSADAVMNAGDPNLPKSVQKVAHYAETVVHLVDAQRTQYLGKVRNHPSSFVVVFSISRDSFWIHSRFTFLSLHQVNYNYVKLLAKKRRQIIDEILEATLRYFPDETDSHPFLAEVAQTIETFFLLDHCEEADEATEVKNGVFKTPKKYSHRATPSGHHRVTPSGTITLTTSDDDDDQRLTSASSLPVPFNLNEAVESLGNMGEKLGTMVKQTLHVTDGTKTPSEKSRATPARIDTGVNPLSEKSISSPVVPYTRKPRRSSMMREHDDVELSEVGQEANLLLDDDRPPSEMVPSYSRPIPTFGSPGTRLGDILENNPVVFAVIFGLSVLFLRFSSKLTVTLDLDIELLLIFAAFCIGLHTPRPMVSGIDKTTGPSPTPLATSGVDLRSFLRKDPHGRMLLRKSMVATPDSSAQSVVTSFEGIAIPEEEPDAIIDENQSPMPRFPEGAALGSKLNCWSEPVPGNFQVRGAKYLSDKKKVPSSGFVFPVRGVDLFLTDACPENAGRRVSCELTQCRNSFDCYSHVCLSLEFRAFSEET